jgi:hypothetical protein
MLVMVLSRRLGRGMVSLLSHAGDGTIETTLVMAQCHCRVMPVMALPRQLGRGVM